jgi:hypothetical protein
MTPVDAEHAEVVVFVGAHPVGDGLQGVFHAHRPQGWATKNDPLPVVQDFKGPDQ